MAAGGRILWGAAFSLAILKTIKVSYADDTAGRRGGRNKTKVAQSGLHRRGLFFVNAAGRKGENNDGNFRW